MLQNMVMVSSVVIIVFAVIFITSYTRVQNENQIRLMVNSPSVNLMRVSSFHLPDGSLEIDQRFTESESSESRSYDKWLHGEYRIFSNRISPDAGISFSVVVDADTNVLEIDSVLDLTEETFTRITQIALEETGNSEIIIVDGRTWQFSATPVGILEQPDEGVISGGIIDTYYASSTIAMSSNGYSHIRFVDVTESHQMLQSLALTLAAAMLAVLTIFFFISRFFAKQAVKPMEEAWEKQHRFITDASHELKTPLSVINANCGVLYSNIDEPMKDQVKWVDSISRAADRMTGLVSSLLSLASFEDKKQELHSSTFNLSEELINAVTEMEAVAQENELSFIKSIDPEIMIDSDKEQVCKIISILLENAVKYTPNDGEITTTLTKEKRHITCTVRNTGEGIPAEELPNIFDRFYRGDPARSSESNGYGLGLAIAKAISEQLDAKLTVESEKGEYTEFKLSFEK